MNAFFRNRGLQAAYANRLGANRVLEDLQTAFAEFKDRQNDRVSEIEAAIDDVNTNLAALRIGSGSGGNERSPAGLRHARASLASFLKTGKINAAMRTDSDPDGGYTVPSELADAIQQKRLDMSPIGRLARRVTITVGDAFEEPWDIGDIAASWIGETETRPQLDTSTLAMLRYPVMEAYTLQPVTQRLLDDSAFDIAGWLEAKITDKFARAEGAAFISGSGVNQPRGILAYDTATTADGSRAWGVIQHINTGASGDFIAASSTDSPADCLIDTVYALRAPYRTNARWLMNSAVAGAVRKLKDAEGRFVWADAREGQPPTLLGYPVELDEEMPDAASGSLSIAFGDFMQAYLVVEKPGIRLLRDPYTAKPYVLFYAYRRVGGGLQNSEAVKLVRFGS